MKYSIPYLFVAAVLASCLGLGACQPASDNTNKQSRDRDNLIAPAELVSLQDISIGPPNVNRMWQFKIEYMARENTMVKEGDVILRFDGQRLQDDLVGRKSSLEAAIKEAEQKRLENEAKLEQLTLDLAEAEMNETIARRKVEITDVSRSDIERKKQQAEFRIAQEAHRQAKQRINQHVLAMEVSQKVQGAKIENERVRVMQIEESLQKLNVKAPKAGMVIYASDWSGEKPAIGDTVYMGRTLINLPALDKIAVSVEFDESDTAQVALGAPVKVTLDAFPERPFTGQIAEIGKAYRSKSQRNLKVVFDATVTLDATDLDIMRPGMKAQVELIGSEV
uniref:HlyD family secretion protein n=1 Tax=Ningiella ruwaisensis TaxID=2364274 RepID=UPI0010A039BC|nr:efflux RND transporter periplasmic adaptor subunit [Ningiella ruwaisensis]